MVLFTVVIPTYNRAAFLSKAIDSVLAQTYTQWELIVVDDASTDGTGDLLRRYTDPRITILHNEKNMERSASRNKGIAQAKGRYICFLDSDDYFMPQHLSILADKIHAQTEPEALFHTAVEQQNVKNGTKKIIENGTGLNPVEAVLTVHLPVISVAIHGAILKQFQFDPTMHINEDVYLFALIAARYPVVYIPQVSVVWVLHGNNTLDHEKDYLTPQLKATYKMVNDPQIAPFISSSFKKKKYNELYAQLVYFHAAQQRLFLATWYCWKGITLDPFNKVNHTNVLNVLYHLPGGRWIKGMRASLR